MCCRDGGGARHGHESGESGFVAECVRRRSVADGPWLMLMLVLAHPKDRPEGVGNETSDGAG